jgi:hypothetical protein
MRFTRATIVLPALLFACGDGDGGLANRDVPPAAAVVMPGMESADLSRQLTDLRSELEAARTGDPDRVLTAEAITDRLIHAPRPVDWLGTGYDVEARLRQLQAMADRVVSRLRRGAELEEVDEDIAILEAAVEDLLAQLDAPGGGAAPAPLDSLLAQDPLRDVGATSIEAITRRDTSRMPDPTVAPVQSGPLGRPANLPRDTGSGGR